MNEPQIIRNAESYDLDTREQLEADVHRAADEMEKFTYGEKFINTNKILRWLDRQAAITERELCSRCSPYATSKDYLDTIDELTSERNEFADELKLKAIALDELQKQVDELTAERDKWRARAEQVQESYLDAKDSRDNLQEAIGLMGYGQFYAMYRKVCAERDALRERLEAITAALHDKPGT